MSFLLNREVVTERGMFVFLITMRRATPNLDLNVSVLVLVVVGFALTDRG